MSCDVCQVNSYGWPDGPASLEDLFRWPEFNASMLLKDHPQASNNLARFKKLLDRDIHVFDSYSGMGTASFTLHMQHQHMTSENLNKRATGPG